MTRTSEIAHRVVSHGARPKGVRTPIQAKESSANAGARKITATHSTARPCPWCARAQARLSQRCRARSNVRTVLPDREGVWRGLPSRNLRRGRGCRAASQRGDGLAYGLSAEEDMISRTQLATWCCLLFHRYDLRVTRFAS
jgi:hypothetical protein